MGCWTAKRPETAAHRTALDSPRIASAATRTGRGRSDAADDGISSRLYHVGQFWRLRPEGRKFEFSITYKSLCHTSPEIISVRNQKRLPHHATPLAKVAPHVPNGEGFAKAQHFRDRRFPYVPACSHSVPSIGPQSVRFTSPTPTQPLPHPLDRPSRLGPQLIYRLQPRMLPSYKMRKGER